MRLELRCWVLVLLLAAQLVFMFYYVLVTAPMTQHSTSIRTWSAISFIHQPAAQGLVIRPNSASKHLTITPAHLQLDRRKYFRFFNSSQCFLQGTDIQFSSRFLKCQCLSGWHGPDCGLPEVMWRAFIAARHKVPPKKRDKPRRIVCCVKTQTDSVLAEIFVQELSSVVDLFVIAETNTSGKLSFPQNIQHKILKITAQQGADMPWHKARQLIPDLKYDDLILFMADNQIPNSKALLYFKLYDGWPEPITFRLRWSVFGFFWQHPKRTILGGKASTASMLSQQFKDNVKKLIEKDNAHLIVGDLNHFGGWECSWCLQSPQEIITSMQIMKPTDWDISGKTVDTAYIEDIIGNGLWIDGKTQLLRTSPSRDLYYAPNCVLNNTSKYDYLTQNMYAKFDY